jgi:hypothetical protein
MFRFTIRELLLLTVIVALGVGWLAERRHTKRRIEAIRAWAGLLDTEDYPIELFEDLSPEEYKEVPILKKVP